MAPQQHHSNLPQVVRAHEWFNSIMLACACFIGGQIYLKIDAHQEKLSAHEVRISVAEEQITELRQNSILKNESYGKR